MTILICNKCDKPIPHPQLFIWRFRDGFCHCQPERSKREDTIDDKVKEYGNKVILTEKNRDAVL